MKTISFLKTNDNEIKSKKSSKLLLSFFTILLLINDSISTKLLSNQDSLLNFSEIGSLLSEHTNSLSNLSGSSSNSFSISAGELGEAQVKFGCLNNFFNFSLRGRSKDFVIFNNNNPILNINHKNKMNLFVNYLKPQKSINFNGNLKIRNVAQWKLIYEEDFSKTPVGWSKNVVTECGGIKMLGGYCQFGAGEVLKTFDKLPSHTNLRIEATFHFIDAWNSEVGFMRINNGKEGEMQYAWIENYSAFSGDNGINVCGGRWPEGKFSVPINVSIPHKKDTVKIGFGSTTEQDACDESFGVSGIRIYIK